MANVTISRYECNRDLLPDVCGLCGAPAKDRVRVTYAWNPPWAGIFLIRRMTVQLPLCPRHLRNRHRRRAVILVILLALLAFGALSFACMIVRPAWLDEDVSGSMFAVCLILFFAWVIGTSVAQWGEIKPVQITDRSLTLSNVSGLFVLAVESTRAHRHDEPDADLRYDDVRDDYDEDRGLPRTD